MRLDTFCAFTEQFGALARVAAKAFYAICEAVIGITSRSFSHLSLMRTPPSNDVLFYSADTKCDMHMHSQLASGQKNGLLEKVCVFCLRYCTRCGFKESSDLSFLLCIMFYNHFAAVISIKKKKQKTTI